MGPNPELGWEWGQTWSSGGPRVVAGWAGVGLDPEWMRVRAQLDLERLRGIERDWTPSGGEGGVERDWTWSGGGGGADPEQQGVGVEWCQTWSSVRSGAALAVHGVGPGLHLAPLYPPSPPLQVWLCEWHVPPAAVSGKLSQMPPALSVVAGRVGWGGGRQPWISDHQQVLPAAAAVARGNHGLAAVWQGATTRRHH